VNKPITPQGPPGHTETAQLDRTGKIGLILLIVVVGFVVSVFYHYDLGVWYGSPYPYNTPLFDPGAHGTDYSNNIQLSKELNPYLGSAASTWYPVLNMVFYLFSLRVGPGHTMVMSVQVYTLLIVLALAWFSFTYLKADKLWERLTATFVFTFMTYPVLFALDRGNVESLMLVLLLFFIYFYQRRRFLISSVFLALAITTKLYPLFLLVLYVPEKKYREIGITVGLSVVLTLACLMCFKGGFLANLRFLLAGENLHTASALAGDLHAFLDNNNIVQRGVTLFTIIKVFLIETGTIAGVDMPRFLSIYFATAVAATILVAGYVTFIERELWKRAALLVIAMLLLPQLSAEYKMIHLLIPLFLFVNSTEQSRADTIYALLFGLLLIPKDYYLFPGTISDAGVHDISIAVFLNPAIMLLMSSMIVASGLGRWLTVRRQRRPCLPLVEQGFAGR
jgi:hypothetical protein